MRRTTTRLLPALLLLGGLAATISTAPTTAAAQGKADKAKKSDKSARTGDDTTTPSARGEGRRSGVWIYRNGFEDRDGDRAVLGIGTASSAGKRDTLGVLVESVWNDSPAEKAGVEEGDRIASVNGVSLRLAPEDAGEPDVGGLMTRRLQRELGKVKPGDAVELALWKGGQSKTVRVKTVAADSLNRLMRVARDDGDDAEAMLAARRDRAVLGLSVSASGSRRDTLGALVTSLATDGPAEKAGLVEGDRIAAINGVDLRTASEDAGDPWASGVKLNRFYREMRRVKAGQAVELRVISGGQPRTVRITAAKAGDVYKESTDGRGRARVFFGGDEEGGGFGPAFAPMPPMPTTPPMPAMPPMPGRARVMSLDGGDFTVVAPRIAAEVGARLRSLDVDGLENMARAQARLAPRLRELQLERMGDFAFAPYARGGGHVSASLDDRGGSISLSGLRLTRVNSELASYFGGGSEGGLLVTSANGRAWDGLREGDVIVKVNGDAVSSAGRSHLSLDTREKNELEVIRKGKREKVTLPGRE